jgi:hypothetical protein
MASEVSGNGKKAGNFPFSRCEAGNGKTPVGGFSRFPTSEGTALAVLAERVSRLCPDHRDPERFHLDKSEIVHDLRRLAREGGR